MIVSHAHEFIFIKTVKTAGTSVEIALSGICGADDIITAIAPEDEAARRALGYCGPQNTEVPLRRYGPVDWLRFVARRRRLHFYNHARAADVKRWLGPEVWNAYYKFSLDRNPWDKAISLYYWRGGDERFGSFSDFLHSSKLRKLEAMKHYGIAGKVAVDRVYRYEELDAALKDVSERLGLPEAIELPAHRAKSGTRKDARHYSEILCEAELRLIGAMFAEQIDRMGYPSMPPATPE